MRGGGYAFAGAEALQRSPAGVRVQMRSSKAARRAARDGYDGRAGRVEPEEEPGSEEDEFGEGVRGEDAAGGGLEVVGRDGLDLGAVLLVGGDAAEGEQALSH